MNGIENPIVFYPASVLMIISAILAIWFKNIFYSLLCAIITFLCAGIFYYVLGSEYNAIIQILIYVIAIPVILGVAIMFTDLRGKNSNLDENKNYRLRSCKNMMLLTAGIFILAMVYLVLTSNVFVPDSFNYTGILPENPRASFDAFSSGIFKKYVYAFEIVSLILTIIVVGLTLYKREGGEK